VAAGEYFSPSPPHGGEKSPKMVPRAGNPRAENPR